MGPTFRHKRGNTVGWLVVGAERLLIRVSP